MNNRNGFFLVHIFGIFNFMNANIRFYELSTFDAMRRGVANERGIFFAFNLKRYFTIHPHFINVQSTPKATNE